MNIRPISLAIAMSALPVHCLASSPADGGLKALGLNLDLIGRPLFLCLAIGAVVLVWLVMARRRGAFKNQNHEIDHQLLVLEQLVERSRAAEAQFGRISYRVSPRARQELKHALHAITTDSIRALGRTRSGRCLKARTFSQLIRRGDEIFSQLNLPISRVQRLEQSADIPLLVPARDPDI